MFQITMMAACFGSVVITGAFAAPCKARPPVQTAGRPAITGSESYDPLAIDDAWRPLVEDFVVVDQQRERKIPIRVFFPEPSTPAPVVLFSHGLGGARTNNSYLGHHWSGRGYLVVMVQHPGSDESVWKNEPPQSRFSALKKAADTKNFMLRVQDVPAVLDQLERWSKQEGHTLFGRADLEHVGMSGHSFGAVTTQAVSGQLFGNGRLGWREPRVDAAIAMSPSSPSRGAPEKAFAQISIPCLLMTGTRDKSPIGSSGVEGRLAVFPALPEGDKYELVLWNAEHSAFSQRAAAAGRTRSLTRYHRVVLATSTAFWDTFLKKEPAARAWLNGKGVKSVLDPKDRWQTK